jgi:hypothetical protein
VANWGKPAVPGDRVTVIPSPLGQKNSGSHCFSSGPSFDLTPKDGPVQSCMDVLPSPYGPSYGVTTDSNFSRLEHKLEHKPGVTNPAALAAKIGVEELGQKEMTRRSVEGRKKHEG